MNNITRFRAPLRSNALALELSASPIFSYISTPMVIWRRNETVMQSLKIHSGVAEFCNGTKSEQSIYILSYSREIEFGN